MSTEILRRATVKIRDEQRHAFYLAVADLLDGAVERHERGMHGADVEDALAVARAYLGESS